MKITLDHNCIIHLENHTEIGARIKAIISDNRNQCFVVNIGASEMRDKGVRPDNYQGFEELLASAEIDHLPRLDPMLIFDVTFFDKCLWPDDAMQKLAQDIESALFGDATKINIETEGLTSPAQKKWLNRICDIHTMWCHIQSGNEVFLTTDKNFSKATKLPRLISLGVGKICSPDELSTQKQFSRAG